MLFQRRRLCSLAAKSWYKTPTVTQTQTDFCDRKGFLVSIIHGNPAHVKWNTEVWISQILVCFEEGLAIIVLACPGDFMVYPAHER